MITASIATAPASTRLPAVVPLLAVGTFLMCTTEFVVAGLIQEMAADFSISVAQVGLLITAFAIGMVIGAPTMALATLRLPRRFTLVLALIVFAAGHVLAALTDSFAIVMAARVITALATGAFWSVAAVVATDAAGPARSSRALGVMMSGVGLATVAGVPLGSWAGQLLGWRGAFWALAVLALAAAVVIRVFAPADGERAAMSVAAELRSLTSGRIWLLVLATVLATGAYMGTFSYISPLLTNRSGLPEWSVPLVLVGFGIGSLVGTNLAGRLADSRPLRTYAMAVLGGAIVMGLIALVSTFAAVTIVLIVVLGVVGMGVPPVATGLAVSYAKDAPTLAAAIAVAAFNAGTAIASWVDGLALSGPIGAAGPAFVGLVLAVVALIPIYALTRMRRSA